jgi:hypothetical protein
MCIDAARARFEHLYKVSDVNARSACGQFRSASVAEGHQAQRRLIDRQAERLAQQRFLEGAHEHRGQTARSALQVDVLRGVAAMSPMFVLHHAQA